MDLKDTRWPCLDGGYRRPYDASRALRCLQICPESGFKDIWDELWNELHHQSDVGLASYAAVLPLVEICAERGILMAQPFSLIAWIENCRRRPGNPALPDWLTDEYFLAQQRAVVYLSGQISMSWPDELTRSYLALVAQMKSQDHLLPFLLEFEADELEKMRAGYERG